MVVREDRGLNDHIKDVTRRIAKAGLSELRSICSLARTGRRLFQILSRPAMLTTERGRKGEGKI
jgi:hypothetical protein